MFETALCRLSSGALTIPISVHVLSPGWSVLIALRQINGNVPMPRHLQRMQDSKPINHFLYNGS